MNFNSCIRWNYQNNEYYIQNGNLYVNYSNYYNGTNALIYFLHEYNIFNDTAWTCVPELVLPFFNYADIVALFTWITSCVLLTTSLIIYRLLPFTYQDFRPLQCHMLTLLLSTLCNVVFQISSPMTHIQCFSLGCVQQMTDIAAISWLNVVAYEVCCLFLRPIVSNNTRRSNCKYALQSVYAWGVPIIVLVILFCTDSDIDQSVYWKGICLEQHLKNTTQFVIVEIVYFTLKAINIVVFFAAAVKMYYLGRQARVANKDIQKQILSTYLKLVLQSGIVGIWTMVEFIMFTGTNWSFFLSVIIGGLQGAVVSIIYVCNQSVYKVMKSFCRKMNTSTNHQPITKQPSSRIKY